MKLPTKVKILGHPYRVIYTSSKKITEVANSKEPLQGFYNPHEQKIYVDAKLPESGKVETLLHEMKHAIHDIVGVRISHAKFDVLCEVEYKVLKENGFLKR